ncbi:HYR domain-containing protein [Flavobacteriales bacterium]|nr:HYR domain-containing protein [Flavobacteriales bacterium]
MTRYLLIIPFLLSALFSIAQIVTLNQSDTIQNSDIIRCYTMEMDSLSRQNYPDRGTLEEFEQWLAPRLEEYLRDANDPSRAPSPVLTIPVVFHIITDGAGAENLTAAQVQDQVDQLNIDFRNLAGSSHSAAADIEVEFCLATLDPSDNVLPEPGINRVTTYGDGPFSSNYIDNTVKTGTSWDPDNYLNIWSADISGGLLGWAQFPDNSGLAGFNNIGGAANTDGVVALYSSIGSVANPNPGGGPYARGRTMTHEVGHWIGLRHIWGDGGCGVDDFCNDTPESDASNFGCPNHTSCSTLDMVQNYMDYTDDACMNIFTSDQKVRIRTVMDICPRRASLALSYKCASVPAIAFVSGGGTVINEGTDCSFQDVVLDLNISSAPSADATVTFNSSGTATAALDFDLLTTSVVFPAGTTPLRQVTVRIYNDGIIESNETILLSFTVTTTGDAVAASGDLLDHDITVNNDDVSPETGGSVVILNEDFEAGLGAFTTQGSTGSDRFLVGDAANCNSPYWNVGPSNATQFAYSNDDACNCNKNNDRLTSPAFSLAGTYTDAALTFDHAFSDLQTETAEVQISTGGGFTTIATLTNTSVVGGGGAATTPWVNGVTVNLTPYIGSATVQVRFKYDDDGSWFYGMAIDNIEVTADAPPVVIQTSVNSLLPTQIEVGPNNEVAFYDNTTGDVMCSINNLNGWDYGCTSVEVDRDATVAGGPSVMFWNGATDSELLAKTFYVDPTINSATGAYSITLYYTDAEVSAWELATGKLRTDLKIIKIQDNPIGVVTLTNYSSYNIEMVPAALGQFGSDVSLTATFSTGFSGFGAGDPSLITCNNPTTPTLSFDADPVCPGGSGTSLNIVGTLNDATAWHIYSTNCGTGPVGNTATGTFAVNPGSTTTYYVRGEGGCVVPGSCIDAELTVNDAVNPSITCPGNTTENANGSCQVSLPDYTGSATSSDNCTATPTVTQSPIATTLITGVGTAQTVTLTATDGSSNTANCTFDVTITDNTNPVVTCPSITEINPTVTCGMPDLTGSASVSDNCDSSPTIISQSPAAATALSSLVGTNQTLTITATDASGNTGNCSMILPVVDNIPPAISCPSNTTENANGSCQVALPNYTGSAVVSDGCDPSFVLAQSPGIGAIITGFGTVQTVTITANDASGNSANCTFDVTIVDSTDPIVNCTSITEINPTVSCGMPDLTGAVTLTDNCDPSPTIISQSPAAGTSLASLTGTNQTLTITAVDASGNTGNCSVLLPVVDNIPPVITCPSNTTQNANGFCEISLLDYTSMASATDGCDAGLALSQSPSSGALVTGVGTVQTITLTVIDASSNSASCIFDVTVVDNTNPTIACPSTVTVTADPTTCEATPVLGSPTIGDNCSTTPAINDAPASFPVGNTTVTWTVTDGSTNSASCTQSIIVNTNTPAQPGAISGANSVCSGDSETYSITAVSGATSYTWNLPTGWTGSSTTNSISVTTGPNAGTVSVTANNTCAFSSAQTLAITLQSSPSQPSWVSGSTTPCSGTTETYFITAVPGATSYTWTLPSGWVGTSTSTSISTTVGSGSGSIEIVAVGSCGNSIAQTLSVAPVPSPAQPVTIAGLFTACPSSSHTYSVVAVPNASSYDWTLPSGWTGTSTTNSITIGTSGTGGTISVAAANSCGQSGTVQTLTVSVPTVDDGIPCTIDACNSSTGIVTNTPNNSICDDGLWCNGQETCDALLGCQAGAPPTVDDGNSCTDDSCNELLDQVENINNSDPCDDGNPNTINDQCVNGVCVGTPIGNVWTGNVNTTWGIAGNWSMFVPTSTDDAIIPTSPTGGVFPLIPAGYQASIDNLDVQPGATINVVQDGTLDVFGVLINNGTINVNDGGSLLQRTGSSIAGSGIYHVQRQGSAGFNYDYWSAPISNQVGVPGTSYLYDSNVSTQTDADDSPSDPGWTAYNGAMIQGKGYAGRGAGLQTFSGTAGNGNISFPLVYNAFDNTYSQTSPGTPYNLVGNPYPSAISAAQFVSDNPNIDGTIAFWDDDLTGGSGYNRSDYAYWNGTGGLGTGAGINGAPTDFISSGQGFIVRALNPSTSVNFSNAQRVSGSNTQFFRTNGEISRLWLSVEKDNSFNQVLIGLIEEATNEEDRLYDAAKMRTNSSLSLAAMANNTEHAIMAFPPPTESQIVPLLISTTEDGTYTFKANTMENFVGYQVTFNDVLLNTSESIFEGATIARYLNAGEYENRFYLNFSPSTITNIDNQTERTFTAYVSDENLILNLNQTDELVAKVELLDVSGRIVYSSESVRINNGAFTTPLSELTIGVYLVRLSSESWAGTQRVFYR